MLLHVDQWTYWSMLLYELLVLGSLISRPTGLCCYSSYWYLGIRSVGLLLIVEFAQERLFRMKKRTEISEVLLMFL